MICTIEQVEDNFGKSMYLRDFEMKNPPHNNNLLNHFYLESSQRSPLQKKPHCILYPRLP